MAFCLLNLTCRQTNPLDPLLSGKPTAMFAPAVPVVGGLRRLAEFVMVVGISAACLSTSTWAHQCVHDHEIGPYHEQVLRDMGSVSKVTRPQPFAKKTACFPSAASLSCPCQPSLEFSRSSSDDSGSSSVRQPPPDGGLFKKNGCRTAAAAAAHQADLPGWRAGCGEVFIPEGRGGFFCLYA